MTNLQELVPANSELFPNLKEVNPFVEDAQIGFQAGIEACFYHLVAFAPVSLRMELADRLGLSKEQRAAVMVPNI